MKWAVHRRLASALAASLTQLRGVERQLLEGVVEPDVVRDTKIVSGRRRLREVPVKHHGADAVKWAYKYAWRARIAWLKGDRGSAAKLLGRALHYVQDYCVGRGLLIDRHEQLEELSAEDEFLIEDSVHLVYEASCRPIEDPYLLEGYIASLKPQKKDHRAMLREAAIATGVVGSTVLNIGPCPEAFLEQARSRFKLRLIGLAAVAGAALMLAAIHPLLIFASPALGYVIDWPYRRSLTRLRWYGIKLGFLKKPSESWMHAQPHVKERGLVKDLLGP